MEPQNGGRCGQVVISSSLTVFSKLLRITPMYSKMNCLNPIVIVTLGRQLNREVRT